MENGGYRLNGKEGYDAALGGCQLTSRAFRRVNNAIDDQQRDGRSK